MGVEQASIVALRQFRNMILQGWPMGVAGGEVKVPHMVLADAGYMTDVVYAFCRESGNRFIPSVGRGAAQQHPRQYNQVTQTGSTVAYLGEGFHINWLPRENVHLTEVDADHWKTWVHQRLCTPVGSPGSMTFFQATPTEHFALAKHLTAEVKIEEFIAGKGIVTKWERRRKQNHWFDTLYNACAAGHYCGVRLVEEEKKEPPPQPKRREPERQPWIDIERWRENNARLFGHLRDRR
jgi:hypothetical protein